MAAECPCGCGRLLGLGAREMASRSRQVVSWIPVLERVRDKARPGSERAAWSEEIARGKGFAAVFLRIAHDQGPERSVGRSDLTPELAAFRRRAADWEANALNVARRLRSEDREWYAAWVVRSAAPDRARVQARVFHAA